MGMDMGLASGLADGSINAPIPKGTLWPVP